jgi:addiction module RelE/StbE family toxin
MPLFGNMFELKLAANAIDIPLMV